MKKHTWITLLLIFSLTACTLPNAAPAPAEGTNTPQAATETLTPLPSLTPTPEVSPTASATPEPSETATPEIIMAEFVKETNCRLGPGAMYERLATFQSGVKAEVVAQDLGGGYVYIRNPEKPEEICSVPSANLKIEGSTSGLPAFTPPPSPTAAPYFEISFHKYEKCNGKTYLKFNVTNTGGFALRSVYIKATVLDKNNVSVETTYNAFDLWVGCVIAENVAPLNSGSTGYLRSPEFEKDPGVNKIKIIVMACTEKDLKGSCVTQQLEIKP